MKKSGWILGFLVICLLIGLVTWPLFPALTITNGKSDQLVFAKRMDIGEHFSIRFIHSIHKTPVEEEYFINKDFNIVLNQVTYESYGVGNPSTLEPGETFKMENGKFIIGNMNRVLPFFDQAIGQIIANHHIQIKGQWIALSTLSPPGSWVRLKAKKVSAWQLWTAKPIVKK